MRSLSDGPVDASHTLLLAHGAGAGMEHGFMHAIATGVAALGIRVVRFEFPYMALRRVDGRKRPPDRMPKLLETMQAQLAALPQDTVRVIGGKSMGGRVATLLAADEAAEQAVAGVVCLGFPFHPPGKPERCRGEHLAAINTPTLILQGERDPFGSRPEVESYPLSHQVRCHYLPDGEHSFKPRKASGLTEADNQAVAVDHIGAFIHALPR